MSKKVIRLTESDLVRMVKKVIREEKFDYYKDYLKKLNIIEYTFDQTESLPYSMMENYLRKLISIKYEIKEDSELTKNEKEKLLWKWEFVSEKISDRMSELNSD